MKYFRQIMFLIVCVSWFIHTASAQTWLLQQLETQGTGTLSLKAVDENTVWAGALNGIYRKTTDGGANWTSTLVPGAEPVSFLSIAAIDQNTAYLMGENFLQGGDGRIYKTTDGGATWTLQYQNTNEGVSFTSIAFWDQDNGIAVSDPVNGSFLIITTTNGGDNWNEVPSTNITKPLSGEFAGAANFGGTVLTVEGITNAWFGTTATENSPVRVFRSTDKGLHWEAFYTPLSATGNVQGVTTIAFQDSITGFVGGFDYSSAGTPENTLAKTTDGGKTWTIVDSFLKIYPSTLVYIPGTNNSVLFATSEQGVGYSNDSGATWRSLGDLWSYALTFVSPTVGWTVGRQNGTWGIYKFVGDLSTFAANEKSHMQPIGFELMQNYPNPFNPATTIRFQIPEYSFVTIKIYDVLGKEIETLFNEEKPTGNYELNWNAISLPSGVYFYRLQAGKYIEIKKMLFMK